MENSFGHIRGDLLRDGLPRLRGIRLHQLRRHLHLQDEVQGLRQGPHPAPDDQVYVQYLSIPRIGHRKKSFSMFPSPAGMSLTKLSLGGNYDVKNKLFLPRESFVSDVPAGYGNIEKLFLQWTHIK